jgi:cyclopropane-fatty-acyl-phospholipid synthase
MPTLNSLAHPETAAPPGSSNDSNGSVVTTARRVIEELFGSPLERRFAVRYWTGLVEEPPTDPAFTLVVARPSGLRRMLLPPTELSIAEAYLHGDLELEGDIESAALLGDIAVRRLRSFAGVLRLARSVLALPRAPGKPRTERVARQLFRFGRVHTPRRDARAVRFHYDVGNAFYALWLDPQMVYSCGYFEQGHEEIDAAQRAKLDYVCRKLRLAEGERLLDIGCGWGALVIHAAQHYGARAVGITLSEQQAAFARDRVAREGLADRVTIEVRDYRDLGARASDRFDKISSIGMVEHVGAKRLEEYYAAAYRVLEPGGLFLNHGIVTIARARPRPFLDPLWRRLWKRDQFIRRYVFPDGDLVPTATIIAGAERQGFELRDIESLREHYVTTLRHWVRRLEASEPEARAMVGDLTYRVWRLYMAAAAYGFRIARTGVIQSLFARPDVEGRVRLPRNRADLYAGVRSRS